MTDIDTWEWFGNRTFHHSQFAPPAKLRAAKERVGLTVSVCLPTRDEAATVGGIVKNLRRNLVERARLVDEIVVMDGGSADDTAAIAEAEGAVVFYEHDVLPGEGRGRARARPSGRACTSARATCSASSTPTSATSTPASSTGCSARCWWTPRSST